MRNFCAVLLAGGASSRMGQPKALIQYQGLPLWRFQANTLLALDPSELFISASAQFDAGEGPWIILEDRKAGLGPLSGLEAALEHCSANQLVVLAVDMPCITFEFLKSLLDEAGNMGIVPSVDGFYHGTVAVYPRAIYPRVEAVLATEDRSFQHLVSLGIEACELKTHFVTEHERPLFSNLNTPADLIRNKP